MASNITQRELAHYTASHTRHRLQSADYGSLARPRIHPSCICHEVSISSIWLARWFYSHDLISLLDKMVEAVNDKDHRLSLTDTVKLGKNVAFRDSVQRRCGLIDYN